MRRQGITITMHTILLGSGYLKQRHQHHEELARRQNLGPPLDLVHVSEIPSGFLCSLSFSEVLLKACLSWPDYLFGE